MQHDLPLPVWISCARGVSSILAKELETLGFPVSSQDEGGVVTTASLDDCLKLNLHLRTAQRVLLQVAAFTLDGPDRLYQVLRDLPWEDHLYPKGHLSITATVHHPTIRDTRFAALKTKDAVVDRLQAICGSRPDTGGERDGAVLHLHWRDDQAVIYLDTSGEPLSRRGYRRIPMDAPMQETLAAACVLASNWDAQSAFVNPMCGSGTLAIEAALLATGRAPGLTRNRYGFMHIRGYREAIWKELVREARNAPKAAPAAPIIASDIREAAVEAARRNAAAAGVEEVIQFSIGDFRETILPPPPGVIYFNPEYGHRMGDEHALEPVYRAMGDFMKQKANGYRGYIFTGNLSLSRSVGLRTSRRITLFNGGLECRLLEYELYAGTRDP